MNVSETGFITSFVLLEKSVDFSRFFKNLLRDFFPLKSSLRHEAWNSSRYGHCMSVKELQYMADQKFTDKHTYMQSGNFDVPLFSYSCYFFKTPAHKLLFSPKLRSPLVGFAHSSSCSIYSASVLKVQHMFSSYLHIEKQEREKDRRRGERLVWSRLLTKRWKFFLYSKCLF